MADFHNVSFSRFTFTLREAQFARPNERGQWRRANCTQCGQTINIGSEDRAVDLLHLLYEHSCRTETLAPARQDVPPV